MNDMQYRPGTTPGPFSHNEMETFRRQMRLDVADFDFDGSYVAFIQTNNGGEPIDRHFPVEDGEWFAIDRFLNFADRQIPSPDLLFHVYENWDWIEDRLSPGAFPFAVLPGGDYLLFDHTSGSRRRVVPGRTHLEPLTR